MSQQQKRILWPTLVVLVLAAVALAFISARAKSKPVANDAAGNAAFAATKDHTAAPLVSRLMSLVNSRQIDSQHATLRATGFEPNEFTRPAGRFLLSVDNRAEMGEMTFRLVREDGSLERDLPPKHDKFRLRQVIELAAGRYALVVANHPEWVCHITITSP